MNTFEPTTEEQETDRAQRVNLCTELSQKLVTLAQAATTREALHLMSEIVRALGAEPESASLIVAGRTSETKSETSDGDDDDRPRREIDVSATGGRARLRLVCRGQLTPRLVREIEAVAQVCVLRAELCERRLWRAESDGDVPGKHIKATDCANSFNVTGMVINSEVSRILEGEIARAARSPHSVLITGETGTGKTTTARAIHKLSSRAQRPFVEINCAAIPEALLEAELFGYERGAFTGAVTSKRGQFEEADGGTLFLDEVGELTPTMQAKLLKAIEEKSVRRLGALRAVNCNVRLLAATSQNLPEMIRANRFREDLYYRLEVLEIQTAPLRERREDIPVLIERRLQKEQQVMERRTPFAIEVAAIAAMRSYDWPGNIRQLQNVVAKLAAYAAEDAPITAEDVRRVLRLQVAVSASAVDGVSASPAPPLCDTVETSAREDETAIASRSAGDARALECRTKDGEINLPADVLCLRVQETLKKYLARVKVSAIEAARAEADGNMFSAARRLGVAYPTLNQGLKKARRNAA